MQYRRIILLIIVMVCASVKAQQTPVYSQYVLNEFIINPSVAGVDGMTSINLSGRKQWVGWENPPQTYSASISTRILKSRFLIKKGSLKKGSEGRVGLGASFISDRNGAINRTGIQLTYAYHLMIRNSQLSFGLSGLMYQFKIDGELAGLRNPGSDPVTNILGRSSYIPDAAAGINYSSYNYHIGFSAFQLFQSPIKFGDAVVDKKQLKHIRHYHLIGSYTFDLNTNPDWEVEPGVVIRATERLQASADLGARIIYKREYWAGLSFRTNGDFIFFLGLKLGKAYIGYAFDYGFNGVSRLTYGSHEALIAFKFGDSTRRYRWWERY